MVGKTSSWIDVDSPDADTACQSEVALRQQLEWAAFLSLHACVLPLPPRVRNHNFACIVNQVRRSLQPACCIKLEAGSAGSKLALCMLSR